MRSLGSSLFVHIIISPLSTFKNSRKYTEILFDYDSLCRTARGSINRICIIIHKLFPFYFKIITTMDESCGYRPAPNYNYKSDAATTDEKDNVRLYIQPAPPPDCKVSTVIKYVSYIFQI